MTKALVPILFDVYGISADEIIEAPKGYYGETYLVMTENKRYFLKIDRWKHHKENYLRSLSAAHCLGETYSFVPTLYKTKNGKLFFSTEDGYGALFDCCEGLHTEEYPLRYLFEKLAQIYIEQPLPDTLPVIKLDTSVAAAMQALQQQLSARDPYEQKARQILQEHERLLENFRQKLADASAYCKRFSLPLVLTHGDAGGNCILKDEAVTIIDWDSAAIAPPERDAWFFMHRDEQTKEIQNAYRTAGFSYTLHPEVFAYFAYHSFFFYLCEHLQSILDAPDTLKPLYTERFGDYFSSWIFDQLKKADDVYHTRIQPDL